MGIFLLYIPGEQRIEYFVIRTVDCRRYGHRLRFLCLGLPDVPPGFLLLPAQPVTRTSPIIDSSIVFFRNHQVTPPCLIWTFLRALAYIVIDNLGPFLWTIPSPFMQFISSGTALNRFLLSRGNSLVAASKRLHDAFLVPDTMLTDELRV
jgi:hypothetical protein